MVEDIVNFFSEIGGLFESLNEIIYNFSPLASTAYQIMLAFLVVYVPVRMVRRLLGE